MAGSEFARWWANRLPYYVKVYQETLVGIGVIGCIYYTFYYDGKLEN
uniref:Uncharacterized protein n=1 Tax=Fundulus heteroclitus TaxID=8078 RepID=A0A3Q2PP52_FUNHE